ncbi:MAG: MiaB/RimO family radical SAM methylthiotransferase [Desulfarculaceae bacterium]|nr:MiaB/RimO family radical SAM methylthiotransferase [Desulfarculaceae bacterium]MCF8073374.1 MiaB/RimO family radical SAM methylthiotransferase [Desulfarculaceae bacterium]MCF8103516.1 MiaB/RimO family radical SAM methylthiotransferase [Desulfarculaceae bacterium]MCF8115785.1 MiaB/RimO family radical SAM methylthiotransferase [Desulfarculaceae bacterium]
MKLFAITSLGCKVNQAEAAYLASCLEDRGWQRAGAEQEAELVILLTCSVTGTAARQSRQMARRLRRQHPDARVVATGCDAQADPVSYSEAGCKALGRSHLAGLADSLDLPGEASPPPPDAGAFCPGVQFPGPERTRGLLKVQDGCDAFCAYCIVPHTRGRPRSLPIKEAAASFAELGQARALEVVLTGIHLGRWGRDLSPRAELTGLLEALLAAHPAPRLRLSSLESEELSDGVLALAKREERICPHFHLPLQTGSAALLRAMGRPYRPGQYAERVHAAREAMPGACLGADVLVGLPGEGEAEFAATRDLVASLPISYLHVFPYSPRPGTPAADMPGRPASETVKERAALLRALGREKRLAYYQAQVGRTLWVIIEGSGLGRAANYCLVRLEPALPAGEALQAKITACGEENGQPVLLGSVA